MPAAGNAWDQLAEMVKADSITQKATNNLIEVIDNDQGQLSNTVMIVGNATSLADAAKKLQIYFLTILDNPCPGGGASFDRMIVVSMVSTMLGAVDWNSLVEYYLTKWDEGVR